MCGGHGAYRRLGYLVDETIYDISRRGDDIRKNASIGIDREVKMMYARGEIDSGVYHRLMEMSRSGQLSREDLELVEKNPTSPESLDRHGPRKRDTEIVGQLNKLYTHRKQLEKSRRETEEVLQSLEKEAGRLNGQVKAAQENAQQSIANEEIARAYLKTKQEALERARTVQARIKELRQNLNRIESLEADLATREAELKALESGEQLAELEALIREELQSI